VRPLAALLIISLPLLADLPPEELDAKLAEAREIAAKGDRLKAVQILEQVMRGSPAQAPKFAARDEIYKIGPIAAPKQNEGEAALVARRILDEKHRYYRDCMDRTGLRGRRLFRLRMWEDNGKGKEDGQVAAIRELDARILKELLPKEDREEIEKIKKTVKKEDWVKAAEVQEKKGKKHLARDLLKDAFYFAGIPDGPDRDRLTAKIEALEKEIVEAASDEEKKVFEDAVNHRAWGDLVTRESHHFIFIGDRLYVPRIPEQSILYLDLAYIFLTDMLDNNPDADGQRITIFFKELWNFGGGIGGGKTIDIGSVNIQAKNISVSNGLYFHELSHCLFDTAMIYPGFTEGVANFGATMALDCVGLKAEADVSFRSNIEAFKRDFLGRDMEWHRIQSYGPTCGFWLHFADKYGRGADTYVDWSRWRKFYRLWRKHPGHGDRTVEKGRVFAHCLERVFGAEIWKDLERFGWPVSAEDDARTKIEEDEIAEDLKEARELVERGLWEEAVDACQEIWDKWPDHHEAALARRLALICLDRLGEAKLRAVRDDLGIIMEWKCAGPFYSTSNSSLHDVHPPEYEIDYGKEYPSPWAKATWFEPEVRFDGFVPFEFPYMDGIACYGLVNAKVPQDTEAWLFVGSDDGHAVWVNGDLAEKHDSDRGYVFDNERHPVLLKAGWNRVLVKIRNGGGGMGFGGRLTDRKGKAIPGLELTGQPRETCWNGGQKPGKAEPAWKDDFAAKNSASRYTVPCGGWKTVNNVMFGTDDRRNMQWRKFLVTPGQEKDSPAQCIWLPEKTLKGAKDFAMDLKLALGSDGRPKFSVTMDGEGQNDGLSGISLIFYPNGEGCSCRLEHYDRLVYHNPKVEFPAAKTHDLRIVRWKNRLTVTFDQQPVFDDISMPAISTSNFLGIMTWDKGVGLDDLTVYKLEAK
jgi:hypothetical protein